jgi:hypothetical protein
MDPNFFVLGNTGWILAQGRQRNTRATESACAVGPSINHLIEGCRLLVKFRADGKIVTDDSASLLAKDGSYFINSDKLVHWLNAQTTPADFTLFYFEGSRDEARCIVTPIAPAQLHAIEVPERLAAFGVPSASTVVIDAESLTSRFRDLLREKDSELLLAHADRFLNAPNIIVSLFAHLQMVRAEDTLRFPITLKILADQLRTILLERTTEPQILAIRKSHLDAWAEVETHRFGFLDGGAARITALPGMSPSALRVGIYSVRPGVEPDVGREVFWMRPYIVGNLLDQARRLEQRPDVRRLQEAARYVLEPLSGVLHLKEFPDTRALFLHGPLVNQFTQYDETKPNFVPFLDPGFLSRMGVEREDVIAKLRSAPIPKDAKNVPMWNQFTAIYTFVMRAVEEHPTRIAGVVERPVGRPVSLALLQTLEEIGEMIPAERKRFVGLLEEYDITDDFLFGCILREGEYLTPVGISKNPTHTARVLWMPVVKMIPRPKAMLLKSEETNFPFRIEMNTAAASDYDFIARFLYHTARLLPRYAFPVGLDIADKYAKIPDWLSRGYSAELAALAMRKAMEKGDARLLAALRTFLARGPRDFFYRPKP